MPEKQLTRQELNKLVWSVCDTFRGAIDPSEYKNYILTMLFIKYLSDMKKDRVAILQERYGGSGKVKCWSTMPVWQEKFLRFLQKFDFVPSLFKRLKAGTVFMGPVALLPEEEARKVAEVLKVAGINCDLEIFHDGPPAIYELTNTIPIRIWRDLPLSVLFQYLCHERIDARLFIHFYPEDREVLLSIHFLRFWWKKNRSPLEKYLEERQRSVQIEKPV